MSLLADVRALFGEHPLAWLVLVAAAAVAVALWRSKRRNLAFFVALAALVLLAFVESLVPMGSPSSPFYGALGAVLAGLWPALLVVGGLVLFAAGCVVVLRLARRHEQDDKAARRKALAAIGFSLLLGLGALAGLYAFEQAARDGIYESFVNGPSGLNTTLGEAAYLEARTTIEKRTTSSIPTVIANLAQSNATIGAFFAANPHLNETSGDLPGPIQREIDNRTARLEALRNARKEVEDARIKERLLTPNHRLWLLLQPHIAARDEAEIERIVGLAMDDATVTQVLPLNAATVANQEAPCVRDAKTGFCAEPLRPQGIRHEFFDAHEARNVPIEEGAPNAFKHLNEFRDQLHGQMIWFGYSMVPAILMAPFAFAGGSILRNAFVPSDTVGFKPYPGRAAGWFLLLGAFGVLSIPFAAWVLRDLSRRSLEGQIAL